MYKKIFPLLLIAALAGCSSEATTPTKTPDSPNQAEQPTATTTTNTFIHIIATDTEYYTDGPQQARPPDGTLKAGTKVKVVEEAGSYCRVEAEDGIVGFIAVDVVKVVE